MRWCFSFMPLVPCMSYVFFPPVTFKVFLCCLAVSSWNMVFFIQPLLCWAAEDTSRKQKVPRVGTILLWAFWLSWFPSKSGSYSSELETSIHLEHNLQSPTSPSVTSPTCHLAPENANKQWQLWSHTLFPHSHRNCHLPLRILLKCP